MIQFACNKNKLYLIFKTQSKLISKRANNEDPSFQCHIRELANCFQVAQQCDSFAITSRREVQSREKRRLSRARKTYRVSKLLYRCSGYINCHLTVARRGRRPRFEIALFGIKDRARGGDGSERGE